MIYTPENIIENLENVGPWSSYYLAELALKHYFPDEFNEDGDCDLTKMPQLCSDLGCEYWQDLIIKYQNEIGYKSSDFSTEYVNEH